MEIIKSNLQSLNIDSMKRHSYIKPPVPPKPKYIPKPKNTNIFNDLNSKVLIKLPLENGKLRVNENHANSGCNRHSVSSDASLTSNSSSTSSNIESQEDTRSTRSPCSSVNVDSIRLEVRGIPVTCADPETRLGEPKTEPCHSLEENKINDVEGSYDVPSSLMEKTLEDCEGLNSKSSSNSSISCGDSDCDDFSKDRDGSLSRISPVAYPAPIIIDSPCVSSIGNDVEVVIHNSNAPKSGSGSASAATTPDGVRTRKAFLVAKEILTSEQSFVASLKLLNEDFRSFLISKGCCGTDSTKSNGGKNHKADIIPERQLEEIFKFLPNLQSLNEEILADFQVRLREWEKTPKIADIIVRKGPFLKLYATYIMELERHTNLLRVCAHRYSFFGECLREFESSELCRHIPVSKHMLTPMQRITKYKELMKQYLKYLTEDHVDYSDAILALEIVKGVADHANEAIRELENSARLLCLQERLNGISNADSTVSVGSGSGSGSGSSSQLQHLLVEPGRRLLKEGQLMKLCRRGIRVVYLILLSDSLLYTIEELHGGKNCPLKLRYKLPLEGMRVDIPVSEDFQSEFTVISTSRSFTVRARCAKERDEWFSCLRDAIESNANRRYSFERAKTAEFEYLSLNVLGKQAPAWIPDNRVTMCQVCTSEFSLTFRRHHCRACGKVVCRHCSSNRAPLAYLDNHTERVCDYCFEELMKAVRRMEEKGGEISDEGEREGFLKSVGVIKRRFKKGFRDSRNCRMKKPERLLEVCGGDHASQICGYLRHFSRRTWRQSWFVLKSKVLYEYRAPEDVCALSSLPILGYKVNTEFKSLDIFDGMDYTNAFQLLHSNQSPLIFYAESNDLARKWRSVMEKEVDL